MLLLLLFFLFCFCVALWELCLNCISGVELTLPCSNNVGPSLLCNKELFHSDRIRFVGLSLSVCCSFLIFNDILFYFSFPAAPGRIGRELQQNENIFCPVLFFPFLLFCLPFSCMIRFALLLLSSAEQEVRDVSVKKIKFQV